MADNVAGRAPSDLPGGPPGNPVPRQGAALVGLPAVEIAARVRSGALSAVDVVRAHLAHIAAVDARVGAFRVVRAEAALAEAAAVDAAPDRAQLPLAGVPVAVKDVVPVAGELLTDGSAAVTGPPEPDDHPVVARLRAAGAVVVGITRVPELCLYAATDGPGTVSRNPWDTARSPAGSSGGSAAAVAAGCVPIAHGSDGMGSLRLPAAACGLVTLKPGTGVVPAGIGADSWSGMAENGALATTVADLALAHAVLAGAPVPTGGAPAVPVPLRVAVAARSPLPGLRPDAAGRAALDATVAALRAAGHTVVARDPRLPPSAALGVLARWLAAADRDAEALGLARGQLLARSRVHARLGSWVRRAGLVRPATATRFRADMVRFFDDVDVLVSPVVTGPPLPARPWHERGFLANALANARWAPWVSAWNLAGLPALVLPAGSDPAGLPRSVQLVGPPGSETRLLWLAADLGARRPWRRHAPVFDPVGPAGAPSPSRP
ncbi:amidase [Modestobacter sp. I12A-02628]|uniref:Amidase n=1 Tax=Goekera deserti TaxID=2497753 RepID=A0A7K3WEU5_9ACTN|nr:amidase [Goekera deserti]MPQ96815.1 amidase [Goekera deserti]NDI46871.1 amidase [Goekera deserti]NEL54439.1 amidase [Goekera deserti]